MVSSDVHCYGLNCVPDKKRYIELLTSEPVNVILFEEKTFAEVVKLRSLGWALMQYDCHPYKKKKIGQRDKQRYRENTT